MISTEKNNTQLEEGYKLSPTGEIIPDYDTTIKYFDEGDLIKGKVVQIDRYEVLVDVGYKSEGVIPQKELSISNSENPKNILELGQDIETVVVQKEDSEGRLILSKKRADMEQAWIRIEEINNESKTVKGTVIEIVRGGLILDIGVRSFLPASLVDTTRTKNLDQYRGQELECKIIEFNRQRNNVVLSRKAVISNDKKAEKQEIIEKLEKGQKVKGVVSSIVDFGAFVDLGGIDGLIHISEMSWEHINHPSEILSVGKEVEVLVLDIDNDKNRVSLGLKQTQDDPLKEKLKDYEIGQVINGKVSKILPFGVFVEFGEELEGLIHISELAHGKVVNPKEIVDIGKEVETKLISIDLSRRRISLSIKQLQETEESKTSEEEQAQVEEAKEEEVKEESKAQETEVAETDKPRVDLPSEQSENQESSDETQSKADEDKQEEKAETEAKEEVKEESKTAEEEQENQVSAEDSHSEESDDTQDKLSDEGTPKEEEVKEEKKPVTEDEALLEKLAKGPTKIEDEKVDEIPESSSLEDVLEQMKKSHGAKK